jgi:diguanylate cyclase (GGDEF)-like protein
MRKLPQAIAGIRKAAGDQARLVLCCQPSGEPLAREALGAGANDYIIYPPEGDELDKALALPTSEDLAPGSQSSEPAPTWEELTALAGILAGLGGGRQGVLDRLCRLLADSLRATHVRVLTDRDAARIGEGDVAPVLEEPIQSGGRTIGKILIGPRHHLPFSAAEAEKLRHFARLAAHLLDAVDQQEQWQSLALIDQLTQLPNRRYLMEQLEALLRRAARERFRVTVLIFDLDGFKHFNDVYGHAAGDEILRDTGQLFRRHCRQHDIVARYAGDEFVVVFWDADEPRMMGSKHPSEAVAVLRRFKKALEAHEFPRLGPEAVGCITISGGLASFPWDGANAEELIHKADQALLQAKHDGKNRIYLVGSQGRPVDAAPGDSPE